MKTKIICLLCACSILFMVKAQDNSIKQRTISVSGKAEMEIIPDEIYVQVDLREYDKKGVGKIDIETIKNNFLQNCQSIGLSEKEISVQNYSGADRWWQRKNKKQNPDLKASISYWVKLNSTNKMDELVNKLDDEATENFFISKTSHSKIEEFRKQLKIDAVKNAKEKANYLADAVGEKVGEAIIINEPNEMFNNVDYKTFNTANLRIRGNTSLNDIPALNIDFKKIKLEFTVNVTFALK